MTTHIELHHKNGNIVIFPVANSVFIQMQGDKVECINPAYTLTPVESYQYVTDLLDVARQPKPRAKK